MLILLPPSEGKTSPDSGPALDLEALSFPMLTPVRSQLLNALVRLCEGRAARAAEVLGLGPTQADAILANAVLREAPCAPAGEIYTGVLFGALDLASLDPAASAAAARHLAVASGLFGLVGTTDLIPAYRLSAGVNLPRLGPLASRWRERLPRAIAEGVGANGLLVDLRSGAYVGLGRPPASLADRTATLRVLHERDGKRSVVSHFNKATKGQVVRQLLERAAADQVPGSIDDLTDLLTELGWSVERDGGRLDLVVTEVPTH